MSRSMSRPPTSGSLAMLPPDLMWKIGDHLSARNLAAMGRASRGLRTATQPLMATRKQVDQIFRQVNTLVAEYSLPRHVGQTVPGTVFKVTRVAQGWQERTAAVVGTFVLKGRPFEVAVEYEPAQTDGAFEPWIAFKMRIKERGRVVVAADTQLSKYTMARTLDSDLKSALKEMFARWESVGRRFVNV